VVAVSFIRIKLFYSALVGLATVRVIDCAAGPMAVTVVLKPGHDLQAVEPTSSQIWVRVSIVELTLFALLGVG